MACTWWGWTLPPPTATRIPHYVLLGANMVIVENLTGLERIGRDIFELIVVPLPLRGLEASPVRAVAALPPRDSA